MSWPLAQAGAVSDIWELINCDDAFCGWTEMRGKHQLLRCNFLLYIDKIWFREKMFGQIYTWTRTVNDQKITVLFERH